jgi:hypothetical protein
VSAVAPRFGPTTGGATITLLGNNFGAAADSRTIRLGVTACATVAHVSHTELTCVAPAGVGVAHVLNVDVAGLDSAASSAAGALRFSYAPPEVSELTRGNGPKTGGAVRPVAPPPPARPPTPRPPRQLTAPRCVPVLRSQVTTISGLNPKP